MSQDLADFSNEISWFFSDNEKIEVIDEKSFICSKEFEEKFPSLTKLLKKARITKIKYENQNYQLFGWTNQSSQSFGWLCLEPRTEVEIDKTLHPDHILLLKNFGGITERWNEPEDTWLINLNNALTFEDTQIGFIGFEDYFNEMCQEEAIEVKVKPEEFISFAFEANGNITMYHKQTGEVLMFAADHFFDFITPYENYPEYTLYKIDNCNTFRDWVEIISDQWLNHIKN
jgi:hypothetical protein